MKNILLLFCFFNMSIFANDSVNSFFKENNINISCEKNICYGENLNLKDSLKIKSLKVFLNKDFELKANTKNLDKICNTQYERIKNKDLITITKFKEECKEKINDFYVYNQFKNIIFQNKSFLTDIVINDITIDKISADNNVPLINKLNKNKGITFEDLDNSINLKVMGIKSEDIEIKNYAQYVKNKIFYLKSIDSIELNEDILLEIDFYENVNVILNKILISIEDKKIIDKNNLEFIFNSKIIDNDYVYNSLIKLESPLKEFNFSLAFSLKNIYGFKNKLNSPNGPLFDLAIILPNFDISTLKISAKYKELNTIHNELLNSDESYTNSFNYLKEYINIITEEEEDDSIDVFNLIKSLLNVNDKEKFLLIKGKDNVSQAFVDLIINNGINSLKSEDLLKYFDIETGEEND